MASVGEIFAEHYELVFSLAREEKSATEAFSATDTRGGFDVIVEIVRPTATSVEKARFSTRARRLATARHVALTSMLEAQPTYCVFEAPTGEALTEHVGIAIARSRQKLAWLAQIAGALSAVHKAGVVHGRMGLGEMIVLFDNAIKLTVPVGGDNVTASTLDDVRALGAAGCELVLGPQNSAGDEKSIASRLHDAGVALEAGQMIARAFLGSAITSEDLAEKLAPYSLYAGPQTEPLIPIMPRIPRRSEPS